jgi:hypothetical protein
MEQPGIEKFEVDRRPTIGDAAERRVPEPGTSVYHASPQVLPLMRDARIGRGTAVALTIAFLFMIVGPGAWALFVQLQPGSTLRQNFANISSPAVSNAVSDALLNESAPSRWLRSNWESTYSSWSGDPVGNVLIGRDGFLFYLPDFNVCTGAPILARRQPDYVSNIVAYDQAMRSRGIHLVVMPIPAKTAILASKLCPAYPQSAGPALNSDYRRWIETLRSRGVDILDLTDDFWKMAINGNTPFLPQDSHWTPEATAVAAGRLAESVPPFLGTYPRQLFTTRTITIQTQGDLVGLLGLNGDFKHWPPMVIQERQVLQNGQPANAGDEAKVLVIGDSYAMIGSLPEGSSQGSAGLSHQLMLRLGAGVQLIAGSGLAFPGARQALARNPQALTQKKVVIWEFTSRLLPTDVVPLPPDLKEHK